MEFIKSMRLVILLLVVNTASAQYNYRDSNRIGIGGGINSFDLITDDLNVKPGIGWNIGLSLRGNFYNDFDMVYGIQFSENRFEAASTDISGGNEDVEFKLPSAQISLLLSYKIVENHLSVEFGPMLQVNGKLTYDESNETNIIKGTTVSADDFAEISRFNFYPTIGVTAGVKQVRLAIFYQYGVNNLLSNIKGPELTGHGGIASANLIFYL